MKLILSEEALEISCWIKRIHDVDIATSAFPEEIKQLFPKTIDIGIEHGTVLVLAEEEQYEIDLSDRIELSRLSSSRSCQFVRSRKRI
ncbi:hypothetical protein ACT691_06995 [Vibrio metschnikovii]